MTIRVLAVDDEPLALRQLTMYISRVPMLQLVAACQSAIEAQHVLDTCEVDALFCDINMPDLNGLDFVRSLASPPLVVFTTAYSEYAIEGFKVEALDYLLKPFTLKEFTQTAERLRQRLELMAKAEEAEARDAREGEVLTVRADRMDIAIPLSTITCVQSMGEYLRIFTTGRPRPVVTLLTMKSMEERLPADRFLRIHRSSIVALPCVKEVGRGQVVLQDGTVLSVGDLYRARLEEWVQHHGVRRQTPGGWRPNP